jgi:hypothetical protein
MSKMRAFISYSHSSADRDWIRAFAEALQREDWDVWLDEWAIPAGQSIQEALEKAIRESDVIVSLIGPQSVRQPWLFFELGAAFGMKKTVVPIVSKDVDFAQLPQPIRSRRFLWQESPEQTAHALVTGIDLELNHPATHLS